MIQADPSANTAQLVREHLLMESNAGLISMAGGKWTSYRKMAEEAVDQAVKSFNLTHAGPCQTENLPIVGAEHFAPAARDELALFFQQMHAKNPALVGGKLPDAGFYGNPGQP